MIAYDHVAWKRHEWRRGDRWYSLEVRQDLFGTWVVIAAWGGLRSRIKGQKEWRCGSKKEAEEIASNLRKHRSERGYEEESLRCVATPEN
ncbi:hypothetical protein C7B79_02200 [Chroococcidiopsis cubana CCALA 043]|nr:hypothetical protein C7B79_02200 [Chroococcidiopsis cubana CCALA 043]